MRGVAGSHQGRLVPIARIVEGTSGILVARTCGKVSSAVAPSVAASPNESAAGSLLAGLVV